MHKIFLKVVILSLIVFLTACGTMQGLHSSREIPIYSQNQVLMYYSLKIKIEEAYWTDHLNLSDRGIGPEVKADNKFLVVVISVTNPGNRPLSFGDRDVLSFEAKDANGTRYGPALKKGVTALSLSQLSIGVNLNPNSTVKKRYVFDVPNGNYSLMVMHSKFHIGSVEEDFIEWQISPFEKS